MSSGTMSLNDVCINSSVFLINYYYSISSEIPVGGWQPQLIPCARVERSTRWIRGGRSKSQIDSAIRRLSSKARLAMNENNM